MNAITSVEVANLTQVLRLSEGADAQIDLIIKNILQLFANGEDAKKLRPDNKHYSVRQDLELAVVFGKKSNTKGVREMLEPYIYQYNPAGAVDSEAWVRRMQINDLIGRVLFQAVLPEMKHKKVYIKPKDYDTEVEKIRVTHLPYGWDSSGENPNIEDDIIVGITSPLAS